MDNNAQAVRRTLAVLLVALSFVAAACAPEADSASLTPVLQTVPEGKFTAEFPGPPVFETDTVTAAGHDVVMNSYKTETAGWAVMVGYADYPKGVTLSLDGAAQGSASAVNGTIQTRTETTFMGHPAMDMVIKAPEGVIHQRLVLRERRLYSVMGVGATDKPAPYDRLLATFVLL